MRIINHRAGNFDLYTLRLTPGENIVDDAIWEEQYGKLPDELRRAFFGGKTPMLSLANDSGQQLAMQLDPEPEQQRAKDKIAQVEQATEPEHLDALAQGETRKTVMAAIQKRAKQLADEAEAAE